jgi:hypothetical protein
MVRRATYAVEAIVEDRHEHLAGRRIASLHSVQYRSALPGELPLHCFYYYRLSAQQSRLSRQEYVPDLQVKRGQACRIVNHRSAGVMQRKRMLLISRVSSCLASGLDQSTVGLVALLPAGLRTRIALSRASCFW